MPEGGTLLTLTYQGSNRVTPFYNVMGVAKAALESSVRYLANDLGPQGIRVNAISPGPMKTLAGAAIGGARKTFKTTEANAPLRANATLEAVGGTAVYLASDYGACTTGEIITVDGGYHVWGCCSPRTFRRGSGGLFLLAQDLDPGHEDDLAAADDGAVVAPGGGPPGPDILARDDHEVAAQPHLLSDLHRHQRVVDRLVRRDQVVVRDLLFPVPWQLRLRPEPCPENTRPRPEAQLICGAGFRKIAPDDAQIERGYGAGRVVAEFPPRNDAPLQHVPVEKSRFEPVAERPPASRPRGSAPAFHPAEPKAAGRAGDRCRSPSPGLPAAPHGPASPSAGTPRRRPRKA
jgi:hypothetical protein